MVLMQSYHGDSELEPYHRTSHRTMANTAYYERAAPYSYYEPSSRHELREDYGGRISTHTTIQEPDEALTAGGQARRRIAVACARCRRRKIKCSGDPGDGSGCQGCRSSGARIEECSFHRIASHIMEIRSSGDSSTDIRQYNLDLSPTSIDGGLSSHPVQHRPSLPTLHTRLAWPTDYENQYENSPVDAYTYSSAPAPRLDSFGSSFTSNEGYRNYSTSAPLSAPVSTPLCESNSYSFGALLSPVPGNVNSSRLPSVSAESMSALNMGSLHSSLPTHAPLERRLPVPFTINYPQQTYVSQTFPEPRLADPSTANFRPYINGIHSRNAMPWSVEANNASRNSSLSAQPPSYSGIAQSQQTQPTTLPTTTSSLSDPVLGYQFQPQSSYSPDSSPATVAAVDDSFPTPTTATMLPSARSLSLRYSETSNSLPAISSCFEESRPAPSRALDRQPTSLYSFSSEASERNASDSTMAEHSKRDLVSQSSETSVTESPFSRFSQLRNQPQPQHPTQHSSLRRPSDFAQHRQSLEPGHQTGIRSLDEHY